MSLDPVGLGSPFGDLVHRFFGGGHPLSLLGFRLAGPQPAQRVGG